MNVETCVTIKKKFLPFFGLFSTFLSAQTIKINSLIFFNELALKNWSMNMYFNPIPILGGVAWDAPPPRYA